MFLLKIQFKFTMISAESSEAQQLNAWLGGSLLSRTRGMGLLMLQNGPVFPDGHWHMPLVGLHTEPPEQLHDPRQPTPHVLAGHPAQTVEINSHAVSTSVGIASNREHN